MISGRILVALIIFIICPFWIHENSGISTGSDERTRGDVGLTVDLNITTEYFHPDLMIGIAHEDTEYPIENHYVDIEGDGYKDLVLFVTNITYHGESYDIRREIWIIEGPILENRTYDVITKWVYPNETWNPYLVDLGLPGKYDLVLVDEGSEYHNGSVMIYPFGDYPFYPWNERACTIEISNDWNGTPYDVQSLDIDQDGFNDLLIHKEISYVYTTPPPSGSDKPVNHTKLRRSLLVLDGEIIPSGERNESYFSTVIDSNWAPGPGNTSFNMRFHLLKHEDSFSIINGDTMFIMPDQTEHVGRIFSFDPIDLNENRYDLSQIITHDMRDLSGIGNIGHVNGLSTIGLQDRLDHILVHTGGFRFIPFDRLYKNTTGITLDDCTFFTVDTSVLDIGDFNGDDKNDIFCSFPYYTISTREACGAVNIGFDYAKYSGRTSFQDLQDIVIMGSESYSMIGLYYFGFFVDDINDDGYDDVLVNEMKDRFRYYVINGREWKAPSVDGVIFEEGPKYRGETFEMEIFGRDPQNYARYINYEIQTREHSGDWVSTEIGDIEVNWTSDKPYDGSKIVTICIPDDYEIGTFDIRIRATNTFNLSSRWFEYPSVCEVLNSLPVITAEISRNTVSTDENLNVFGEVEDPDGHGPFELILEISNGTQWSLVSTREMEQGEGEYLIPFHINGSLLPGSSYQLRMKAIDPDEGMGVSAVLEFLIKPGDLSFEVTGYNLSIYRGDKLKIDYDLSTDMKNMALTLASGGINGSFFVLEPGMGSIALDIPLNHPTGINYFNYSGNDGYWETSGSFESEVMNNPPWITLPEEIFVNGTGSLEIGDLIGDREDTDDVTVAIIGEYNGLDIEYVNGKKTLLFNVDKDGGWTVVIMVADSDGSRSFDNFTLVGKPHASGENGKFLTVNVIDQNGDPLADARVTIMVNSVQIGTNTTNGSGETKIPISEVSSMVVKVEPPEGSEFIEGVRSGLTVKEMFMELTNLVITVQLDYTEVVSQEKGSLSVFLKDQRGLPVEGFDVNLSGTAYREGRTDASGSVYFNDLAQGIYKVDVSNGGGIQKTENIEIGAGEDKEINIIVEIELYEDDGKDPDTMIILLIFGLIIVLFILSIFMILRMRKTVDVEE